MQRQLYASAAARKGWRFSATKSQLRWQNCRSFLQLLAALFSSAVPVAVYAITYPAVITGRPSRMCLLSRRVWCNQRGPPQLLCCLTSTEAGWPIRDGQTAPAMRTGRYRSVILRGYGVINVGRPSYAYRQISVSYSPRVWCNQRGPSRRTAVSFRGYGVTNWGQRRQSNGRPLVAVWNVGQQRNMRLRKWARSKTHTPSTGLRHPKVPESEARNVIKDCLSSDSLMLDL